MCDDINIKLHEIIILYNSATVWGRTACYRKMWPNDGRRLHCFSCYCVLCRGRDGIVFKHWPSSFMVSCKYILGQAQVVVGHRRVNETIPTCASLFIENSGLWWGYHIDFIQTVQKTLCLPSSHICKLLSTKHLCSSWFCSVPFSVPNMSLQV